MTRAQAQALFRTCWAQHNTHEDQGFACLSNAHADLAHALGVARDPASLIVTCGCEASIEPREQPASLEEAARRALALIEAAFIHAMASEERLHEALRADEALRTASEKGATP